MTATAADEVELRSQLSRLNALLVLSMLMSEGTDEEQIVQMGANAAPSFARCRLVGVSLRDGRSPRWRPGADELPEPEGLDRLPTDGGRVTVAGWDWAWAYTLGAVGTSCGHLVVAADHEAGGDEHFLLRVLAQQVGAAIRNARAIAFERTAAAELASVNGRLEATVEALRQRIDIHDRLTRAAVSGDGMDGITRAVHEVTGRTVLVEDRFGNVRSWAGDGTPPAPVKDPPEVREQLLRRLLRVGTAQWECGRLVQAVSPRPDSVALLALVDPDRSAGHADLTALEYGATILSLELARLRSMADTEVRLRRDLVEDLLAGTNLDSALERGETFKHDLTRPHSVVVFEGGPRIRDDDALFTAVRRVARERGLGSLLVTRGGAVVLITEKEPDWPAVQREVLRELGNGSCRIGVGGRTALVDGYAASYREALLSLNLIRDRSASLQVAVFEQLGVFRLLSSTEDPRAMERFVREWLGGLLDYDRQRQADLVLTLSTYLECGGRYEETAAALSVHRSTLKYRLQRIRQISGLALGEPDVDFNLQLACRAWRTMRALQGGDPAPG